MTHQTENGHTRIADSLLDAIIAADLSKREYKIVLAVIRHTYGFQRKAHLLTGSYLATATGLTRTNTARTISAMVQRGILTSKRGQHGNVIGLEKRFFPSAKTGTMGCAKTGTSDVPETGTKVVPKQAHKINRSTNRSTDTPLPPTLDPQIWQEFKQHRKEKRAGMTPTAERRALLMLARQPDPTACVVQSLESGWTGLFAVKEQLDGRSNGTGRRENTGEWLERLEREAFAGGTEGQATPSHGEIVDPHGDPLHGEPLEGGSAGKRDGRLGGGAGHHQRPRRCAGH